MSIEFICPECREHNNVGPEFAGRRGTCAFCGAMVIVPQSSGIAQSVAPPPQTAPRRTGMSWVVIVAVVGGALVVCGGILTALLLPAIQAAREAGRRAACMNHLKQIDLALLNYQEKYGHFPPASGGTSDNPVSWRVAILPFMDANELYARYQQDEPWNSPQNLELAKQRPDLFHCLSDSGAGADETSYVMITGKNTMGGSPGSPGVAPGEITDGMSHTILVVEVHGLKIPWTEPRDITIDELARRLRSGGRIGHVSSFNVGMADGSVRAIANGIDVELLRRLAIINDGRPVKINDF